MDARPPHRVQCERNPIRWFFVAKPWQLLGDRASFAAHQSPATRGTIAAHIYWTQRQHYVRFSSMQMSAHVERSVSQCADACVCVFVVFHLHLVESRFLRYSFKASLFLVVFCISWIYAVADGKKDSGESIDDDSVVGHIHVHCAYTQRAHITQSIFEHSLSSLLSMNDEFSFVLSVTASLSSLAYFLQILCERRWNVLIECLLATDESRHTDDDTHTRRIAHGEYTRTHIRSRERPQRASKQCKKVWCIRIGVCLHFSFVLCAAKRETHLDTFIKSVCRTKTVWMECATYDEKRYTGKLPSGNYTNITWACVCVRVSVGVCTDQ